MAAAAALLLFLTAAPARAGAREGLISCFEALVGPDDSSKPISDGPGQDIARWEWAPPQMHTALVVPGKRGGREGFYFFGDRENDYVHFDTREIPRELRSGPARWIPFELAPREAGRGRFRCVWHDSALECSIVDREPKYYPPSVGAVPEAEALSVLRTAAAVRAMSVSEVFRRRAEACAQRLADYRRKQAEPPGAWSQLAGLAGFDLRRFAPGPPSAPRPDDARKALARCAAVDDLTVSSTASTGLALLETVSVAR